MAHSSDTVPLKEFLSWNIKQTVEKMTRQTLASIFSFYMLGFGRCYILFIQFWQKCGVCSDKPAMSRILLVDFRHIKPSLSQLMDRILEKLLLANIKGHTGRWFFLKSLAWLEILFVSFGLKGTVSWDRFQKFWQQFTALGLTKGRGWF